MTEASTRQTEVTNKEMANSPGNPVGRKRPPAKEDTQVQEKVFVKQAEGPGCAKGVGGLNQGGKFEEEAQKGGRGGGGREAQQGREEGKAQWKRSTEPERHTRPRGSSGAGSGNGRAGKLTRPG